MNLIETLSVLDTSFWAESLWEDVSKPLSFSYVESFVHDPEELGITHPEQPGPDNNIGHKEYNEAVESVQKAIRKVFKDLGKTQIVEIREAGCDNEGPWHIVVYFENHDTYVKCGGVYSSYSGYNVEYGPKIVKPKIKEIKVYE